MYSTLLITKTTEDATDTALSAVPPEKVPAEAQQEDPPQTAQTQAWNCSAPLSNVQIISGATHHHQGLIQLATFQTFSSSLIYLALLESFTS